MRLKVKDVEANVFSPKSDQETVKDYAPVGEVVFTVKGQHDYIYEDIPAIYDQGKTKAENRKNACAKKVGHRYYFKMNGKGEIFNPIDNEHLRTSTRIENNLPVWKYVHVSYTTFCHYIHFLKTRNQTFLTLARRDMGSTS